LLLAYARTAACADGNLISFQAPKPLSYDELRKLAVEDPPRGPLAEALDRVLSEPVIDNHASLSGARPFRPATSSGYVLRIAEWNINRGINFDDVQWVLSASVRFDDKAQFRGSSVAEHRSVKELQLVRSADVVILDEADDGMNRTKYRNVARALARALQFNYVYGVEFVELNRLYMAEKKLDQVRDEIKPHTDAAFALDPARFRGLEGTAILSRYPIVDARLIRLPECYDWYHGEIKEISALERARRWSAMKIFKESIRRQVRRGGRMALIADLAVSEAPGRHVTVVAPHLENYCPPSCRHSQMDYLLDHVRDTPNTVVIAGDLNTTGRDGTPTSIRREILKRVRSWRFWAKEALFWFVPVPFAAVVEIPVNYFKNYHDPTAISVPLLLPNRERPLFDDLQTFRFSDGGALNFSGTPALAVRHKSRTLADSNQRSWKGFVSTFSFHKTYFHLVGSFKLDWFFIKSGAGSANGKRVPTPSLRAQCGHTLKRVNKVFGTRISDHAPITVDLALTSGVEGTKADDTCTF
jgi:endonuclease/exonuclease/phosphatase family metal-dependent hydrolase